MDRLNQHELADAYEANGQIAQVVDLLEHVVTAQQRTLAKEASLSTGVPARTRTTAPSDFSVIRYVNFLSSFRHFPPCIYWLFPIFSSVVRYIFGHRRERNHGLAKQLPPCSPLNNYHEKIHPSHHRHYHYCPADY
jgi:hypothetical protein